VRPTFACQFRRLPHAKIDPKGESPRGVNAQMGPPNRSAWALGAMTLCVAGSSLARDVTVPAPRDRSGSRYFDSLVASVTPETATSCPVRLLFVATIKTKVPVTITYRWDRNDLPRGPVRTLELADPGSYDVSTYWQFPQRPDYDGWERLHILSPEDAISNIAAFTLRCAPLTDDHDH
jgi:hypothetical protein